MSKKKRIGVLIIIIALIMLFSAAVWDDNMDMPDNHYQRHQEKNLKPVDCESDEIPGAGVGKILSM